MTRVSLVCSTNVIFNLFIGKNMISKKGDGSQVKESTDSSTTLEDDDIKGKRDILLS